LNAALENKVAERTAELKHRAKQLQKLTLDMSETEDRERKRMAEILHDDLQQQLAGAKFHLGLMRHRARYDASVQAIGAQVDHMLKDAIDKSRSLSHELSPTVLHHADFVQTLRWLADDVQAKHGLLVRVRAPGAVPLPSDALKGFLYRAAQELLFNVVKHAGVNEAEIRVRQCCGHVCLAVSDRGRGFDPQGLGEASGFGLLSIRERIALLGGRMKIKSAKGTGSTFLIIVPNGPIVATSAKTAARPNGRAKAAEQAAEEKNGRLRVLLADDHEIVREGLRSLLSDAHDVEVVGEAANGREAVDLASQLQPDVIIMDMSMPLIEGAEATRQIKAYLPRTRVIALSMYDQSEKVEAMYRAGAENYVLKTAPTEELLAAIRGSRVHISN
jgi:CheY-like chemotaxis protein/two-component sensor histidine kinase